MKSNSKFALTIGLSMLADQLSVMPGRVVLPRNVGRPKHVSGHSDKRKVRRKMARASRKRNRAT